MDGQMERIKQLIEADLQSYCNYEQNYRAEILAVAEFAHNNSTHWATMITPFYVNYVYETQYQVADRYSV
jgi:hypothetical protein